jgi:hypothetical protein
MTSDVIAAKIILDTIFAVHTIAAFVTSTAAKLTSRDIT